MARSHQLSEESDPEQTFLDNPPAALNLDHATTQMLERHNIDTERLTVDHPPTFLPNPVNENTYLGFLLQAANPTLAQDWEDFARSPQCAAMAVVDVLRHYNALNEELATLQEQPEIPVENQELRAQLEMIRAEKAAMQETIRQRNQEARDLKEEIQNLKEDVLAMARQRSVSITPMPTDNTSARPSKAKFPDPPRFDSNKSQNFRAWKTNILNKLRIEARSFPTEQDKIAYIFNRTEGDANMQMQPCMDPESASCYQTAEEALHHLDAIYADPFLKEKANNDYARLQMFSDETFENFFSRFTKLATEAEISRELRFDGLWQRLTYTLQTELNLVKFTFDGNVDKLASAYRGQDNIR